LGGAEKGIEAGEFYYKKYIRQAAGHRRYLQACAGEGDRPGEDHREDRKCPENRFLKKYNLFSGKV
jgi:hypothetical protein